MIECPSGFSGAESGGVVDRPHALVGSPIFALSSGQVDRAELLGSRGIHLPTGADGLVAAGEVDRAAGPGDRGGPHATRDGLGAAEDRKSTRLNSSHVAISYAVFCFKKKKHT